MAETIRKILGEARKEILLNKDPSKAIELLKAEQDTSEVREVLAFAYFSQKEYEKASRLYGSIGKSYQEGFCELLLGNDFNSRHIWFSADESPSICWGRALLGFIGLRFDIIPTFLQIRSFLESDVHYFIQANKLDYAENLMSCNERFAEINLETYKYIGRSLLNNGYYNIAFEYLSKSRQLMPNDPEIYYNLAQYSYNMGDYSEVKSMLRQCLDINDTYTPARKMLAKVEEKENN